MLKLTRLLCLMLCLCLLPLPALAEASGAAFRLTFDLDESAAPALADFAPLVDLLVVEGEHLSDGVNFDTSLALTLGSAERTRTTARLRGDEAFWMITSPLLGDETVYLHMDNMLEFCVKGYSHLGLPAQRLGLLLTPYVHKAGLSALWAEVQPVLFAGDSSRTIPYSALLSAAGQVAQCVSDRAFRYWVAALGRENGYEEVLTSLVESLPEWIAGFADESGLSVSVQDDSEVWSAGDTVLFTRETALDGAGSLTLTLPESPDGYTIRMEAAYQPDNDLLHGSLILQITDWYGLPVLDLNLNGSFPCALPIQRSCSMTLEAAGDAIGEEALHLYADIQPQGSGAVLQLTAQHAQTPQLTVFAQTLTPLSGRVDPAEVTGTGLFTVTSDSLGELVRSVAMPMLRGLLPVIAEIPARTCQALLDWAEDSGVFDLLTDGLSGSDDWDESGDWEEGWDEGWDEDWDEWDEDGDWDDWDEDTSWEEDSDDSDAEYEIVF